MRPPRIMTNDKHVLVMLVLGRSNGDMVLLARPPVIVSLRFKKVEVF